MWKETLNRWMRVNQADTREEGPPGGRTYAAPFARVWDAAVAEIRRHRRWSLVHADEEIGQLSVTCRTPVLGFVDDLTVWIRLDANGLTRVDARSAARKGRGDFGVNRRRVEALVAALDRELGSGALVRT